MNPSTSFPTLSSGAARTRTSNPPRFEALRGMDLFAPLPDIDLRRLSACGRERRAEKDEILLCGSEPEEARIAVLLEGEAVLSWGNGDGELLMAVLEAGDFAGHLEMFGAPSSGMPERGATIRAAGSVRIVVWSGEDVMRTLRQGPELALGFLGGMARQQQQLQRRVAGICGQRAPRRVARALAALFEDHGLRLKDAEGRRCLLLRNPPTRRRLGEIAGTARETVSRVLAQWEHCGWITESQGDLIVRDEAQLRRLAGG